MEKLIKVSNEEFEKIYNEECNEQRGDRGIELLSEAASLLLEDTDKIAELLSPEEIEEIEELRRQVFEMAKEEEKRKNADANFVKAAEKNK